MYFLLIQGYSLNRLVGAFIKVSRNIELNCKFDAKKITARKTITNLPRFICLSTTRHFILANKLFIFSIQISNTTKNINCRVRTRTPPFNFTPAIFLVYKVWRVTMTNKLLVYPIGSNAGPLCARFGSKTEFHSSVKNACNRSGQATCGM